MSEERRRWDRLRTSEQLLQDAFAYANTLAGLPAEADAERALTVGEGQSTWTWVVNGRTYQVHQHLDGRTSVEITLV
jgi:hypothetical protein